MTSVVDLKYENVYTEERRASVVAHGETVHVSADGRGTGCAEVGGSQGHHGDAGALLPLVLPLLRHPLALFNNLTNKLGLLFCSCCAVDYQQRWLTHPCICLCFVSKAWVSLQLFFIFRWKSLKIKIRYECQKALQCEVCCLCTILVEEISINFTLLFKDEYVTGLTSLKKFFGS